MPVASLIRLISKTVISTPSHIKKRFPINTPGFCRHIVEAINLICGKQQTFIWLRAIPVSKIDNPYMVKSILPLARYSIFRLNLVFIIFPPRYLMAFQVWKMPDQYRITIVDCHNFNRCQVLPDQITTNCCRHDPCYQSLIHPVSL